VSGYVQVAVAVKVHVQVHVPDSERANVQAAYSWHPCSPERPVVPVAQPYNNEAALYLNR